MMVTDQYTGMALALLHPAVVIAVSLAHLAFWAAVGWAIGRATQEA